MGFFKIIFMIDKQISTQNRSIDFTDIGGIKFDEASHTYTNKDNKVYCGVTTLLKRYENVFDTELNSINSAIKKAIIDNFGEDKFNTLKQNCKTEELRSALLTEEERKFIFGYSFLYKKHDQIVSKYPQLITEIENNRVNFIKEWKDASDEAIKIGSLEHDNREQDIKDNGYFYKGVHYKYIEGKNITNVTKDDVIVIPECLVWNHKIGLGGLADVFLFNKGEIMVHDYKTNEAIEMKSFMERKMKGVCSMLMDCNYFHYSLQLRIYQQMALDLRKDFQKGDNQIIHTKSVKFNRTNDAIIQCFPVENEVNLIFSELYLKGL